MKTRIDNETYEPQINIFGDTWIGEIILHDMMLYVTQPKIIEKIQGTPVGLTFASFYEMFKEQYPDNIDEVWDNVAEHCLKIFKVNIKL